MRITYLNPSSQSLFILAIPRKSADLLADNPLFSPTFSTDLLPLRKPYTVLFQRCIIFSSSDVEAEMDSGLHSTITVQRDRSTCELCSCGRRNMLTCYLLYYVPTAFFLETGTKTRQTHRPKQVQRGTLWLSSGAGKSIFSAKVCHAKTVAFCRDIFPCPRELIQAAQPAARALQQIHSARENNFNHLPSLSGGE